MAEEESGFDLAAALEHRLTDAERGLSLLLAAAARLGRVVELEVQRGAREEGFEKSELAVLALLWITGPDHPLSPSDLSQLVVQTTSGMTKTLRRLEDAGLVSRAPDRTDGRRHLVHMTGAGATLIERRVHRMLDQWDERLSHYPDDQRSELAKAIWSFATEVEKSFLGRAVLGPRPASRDE